jgi:hypothetical protein
MKLSFGLEAGGLDKAMMLRAWMAQPAKPSGCFPVSAGRQPAMLRNTLLSYMQAVSPRTGRGIDCAYSGLHHPVARVSTRGQWPFCRFPAFSAEQFIGSATPVFC